MNKTPKSIAQPCEHEWVDAQDVMQRLNIKYRTLKKWRLTGVIPHSILGGKRFYCWKCIQRSLADNERFGTGR